MNYIGSKFKLSSWIRDEICKVVGNDLSQKIFCDIFAGTGIVGRTFKTSVKKIIANDIESYSYVLNKNYIGNHKILRQTDDLINELNDLKPVGDGFIYKNYCFGSGSGRQYFSDENGKKIDTLLFFVGFAYRKRRQSRKYCICLWSVFKKYQDFRLKAIGFRSS